jgi:CDP-glucose 4,6-dehydratase
MNWSGKSVLVTGHTGFKGGWLTLWLQQLGAKVTGYALAPPEGANLFTDAQVASGMNSVLGNLSNLELLKQTFAEHQPEIVFHLAAQPLVRASYLDPIGTYTTNVLGTAHLLEAARATASVRAIVLITTDKCYENQEWEWPYRETDRLGGYDPYSNSKACAELVAAAYRSSFFNPARYSEHKVALATVRAGNVIGGGDWSEDRLIPDIIRAFSNQSPVRIRSPRAVRPWQHVLEPIRGYLAIAESLYEQGTKDGEAWNFGPDLSDAQPVEWIVREMAEIWGKDVRWEIEDAPQPHEAQMLKLDCSKIQSRLGWRPLLHLKDALTMTTEWYRARLDGTGMREFTVSQIQKYRALSASAKSSKT